jgi:hypothetical protein
MNSSILSQTKTIQITIYSREGKNLESSISIPTSAPVDKTKDEGNG